MQSLLSLCPKFFVVASLVFVALNGFGSTWSENKFIDWLIHKSKPMLTLTTQETS